jgi:hypothetical protein
MAPKARNLLLSSTITFLVIATGSISAVLITAALQASLHSADAQGVPSTLAHGNITAAVRNKPFGGEAIGTYTAVLTTGQNVTIKINLHKLPEPGDAFEARLLDTQTNSILSLGRVGANSILPVSQGNMSLFAYNQIIITRQASNNNNTSDSNHLEPIGGAALQPPFGNNFIF